MLQINCGIAKNVRENLAFLLCCNWKNYTPKPIISSESPVTKWGVYPIVVISDYQLIKKVFKPPDLQGRPQFMSLRIMQQYNNTGLIISSGEVWAERRRFILHHLRNLGMGKTALEGSIQDEAALLVDYLEKNCTGKPSIMDKAINRAVVNVIWQMLATIGT
ncbi:Cytochrome P450 [Trinorchestia longiramus]|nr:Cytochrome P450 [Trinorchestia longiramus]